MDFKGSWGCTLTFSEIIPVKLLICRNILRFGGHNLDINWINLFKSNFCNLSENNYEEKY
jgi:aromatic ring-opening dioxygenase LigB subunit